MRSVSALLPLLLVACGGGGPLTVVTYNAGLATGYVPASPERTPLTAAAVAGLEADIVCLQEVWTPTHVQAFEDAAAGSFEHRAFPDPQPERTDDAACAEGDLDGLLECLDTSCDGVCDDELIDCVFANCALDFVFLDNACMSCVQAEVGGDVDAVEGACTTGDTRYAYEGAFGTGILSAHPLAETEESVFSSTTNRRSVLHSVADTPAGEVDVYCTHLTAVFDVIPYPRDEGSWEEEQAAQIDDLLAYIDQTASTGLTVLMGDFNTGPEIGDSAAEVEDNWEVLEASGMSAPYVDAEGSCTYCRGNPLNVGDEDDPGKVIDHVFIEGFEGEASAELILTEEIEVERCGEPYTAAYSDHYGVSVTIAEP
jgi:endonuclease/exonuclease/phosphatase family metal-dependent hydrolase